MHDGNDLHFILTDHLGSVSTILDDVGGVLSQQRYIPGACPERSEGANCAWIPASTKPISVTQGSWRYPA